MNADEFVTKLRDLAPTTSVLNECGYPAAEADRFLDSFVCRRRTTPLNIATHGDAMLELIDKWDLSHVEIGPICFHAQPEQFPGHLEIGTIEGDRLVYRKDTKAYALLESPNIARFMCVAALNGNLLLDGLIEVAGYYAKTATDEIDIDDEDTGAEIKRRCMAAFGGGQCESFCTTVLGV